jgi:hypothetical protein
MKVLTAPLPEGSGTLRLATAAGEIKSMDRFPHQVVRFNRSQAVVEPGRGLPLAFIHINKTAGTSFTEYLRGHFRSRQTIAPPYFGDFAQIGIQNDAIELYWGHFTLADFRKQRPRAWFVTFLRDPIQRIISQYRSLHNPANLSGGWEKILPPHARKALEFAQRATFEEFVCSTDPFIVGHIQDLQTRFLSSYRDPRHPEFLTSAIANIEQRLLFVGTTERFDDSIDLFRFQLQSQHIYQPDIHQKNVSHQYPVAMSARVRRRVEELVQNDQRLYKRATAMIDERVAYLRSSVAGRTLPRAA